MTSAVEVMAEAIDFCPEWPAKSYRTRVAQAAIDALESAGFVVVPKAAIEWLDGAAPDADGNWFGDDVPPGRPYWWRTKFRAMIQAARSTP